MSRRFMPLAPLALAAACVAAPPAPPARSGPRASAPAALAARLLTPTPRFDVAGVAIIRAGTRFQALEPFPFGGLSGCTAAPNGSDLLAISDAREHPHWVTLRLRFAGGRLEVTPLRATPIVPPPGRAPSGFDFEAIARLSPSRVVIASEGDPAGSPPAPPALFEATTDGHIVAALAVPDLFLPDRPRGPTRGVRDNMAFESVAAAPDGLRLFTGTEGPLVQDDEAGAFDRPARSRLLEFTREAPGAPWRAGRQFVYPFDPIPVPAGFGPSRLFAGLVDLLVLDDTRLLALERAYIEELGGGRSVNLITLHLVTLAGADDVAGAVSLRERPDARPVRKERLLDLGDLAEALGPPLARLDNFEAACQGPRLEDGSPSLVLMSDDNFSERQVTAIVVLRVR
jgi:hypothetical protein